MTDWECEEQPESGRVITECLRLRGISDKIRAVWEAEWVKTCTYSEESKLLTNTRSKGV